MHLDIGQRLRGGMLTDAPAASAVAGDIPHELVRRTIELTEAGLRQIDTSDGSVANLKK